MSRNGALQFPDHRACETLTGLTINQLPCDGSLGRTRYYNQGTYIWQAGDPTDRIYFLQRGHVAVMVSDPRGREITLQSILPGEPFGELCYCLPRKGQRQTDSRALLASEVVEVLLDDFVSYLQHHQEALMALMFTFCLRLSDAERRSEILTYRGAEERLGRLLLQLAKTRGRANPPVEGQVILHVSHDELAQMAAMSRPHVTVTMGKLRRRGLVLYERNQPLIVNAPMLNAYLVEIDLHS